MKHSAQREVVYKVVMESFDHPTAEMVLVKAKEIMPSINLATVYRNLAQLAKSGKILRIFVEGGDRFDKTVCPHAHFHCSVCQKVFDIDVSENINCCDKIVAEKGCQMEKVDIVFTGKCKECII